VRGDKPASLLDSYTAERRPVAAAVLANTLAQVALMRPDPRSNALRDLFAQLLEIDDVNSHIDGLMSGLGIRYDLGSGRDEVGRLSGDRLVGAADRPASLFAQMTRCSAGSRPARPDRAAARSGHARHGRRRPDPRDGSRARRVRQHHGWSRVTGSRPVLVSARVWPAFAMMHRCPTNRGPGRGRATLGDEVSSSPAPTYLIILH
jgi:hypothetical protein